MSLRGSSPSLPRAADSSPYLPTEETRRRPGRPRLHEATRASERKLSIYLSDNDLLQAAQAQAARLDRSFSWVVAECLRRALPQLEAMSSPRDNDTDAHQD